jgi:hypothetical protein
MAYHSSLITPLLTRLGFTFPARGRNGTSHNGTSSERHFISRLEPADEITDRPPTKDDAR